jgi:hypothetical protein
MPELADYTQGSMNRQTQFWGNLPLLNHEPEGEIDS